MKKLLLIVFVLLISTSVSAASLQWDLDQEARDRTDGFTVYFSDGSEEYTKSFSVDETEVLSEEARVSYNNIEEELNLHPGVEYTFELTRYNSDVESDHSSQVSWTRPTHSPPQDSLPDPVSSPSSPGGIVVGSE